MAIQQAPPQRPPQKSSKAGLGCLGCGCLAVLVVFLGIAGLCAGGIYMFFKQANVVSSASPEAIAAYTASDDVYAGAQKKVAAFNDDVSTSKTSTLTLSSDEVNALLYHTIDPRKLQGQALVTMTGDEARVQASIPSNGIPFINWGVKDRYFTLDLTSGVAFNVDTKEVELQFHKVQFGDTVVPQNSMAALQSSFSQQLNLKLQQNPDISKVLQAVKTVSIKDGQFVVETK